MSSDDYEVKTEFHYPAVTAAVWCPNTQMFPNIWIFDSIFQAMHPDGRERASLNSQTWEKSDRRGQKKKKGRIEEKFKGKYVGRG